MKAALLGIEHPHSLAHLGTLQVLPEVEGILLWDENQTALDEVQRTRGEKVEATFTELDSLLAQDDLFFVIAALRNDLGPDIFVRALEAGVHLMAEKPIGKTAIDTARVVEVAGRHERTLGVCYQNRCNPLVLQARELIAQGLLGPLISVDMRMLTTQVQFRNPQHWLFDKERAGGGILSWLGCHNIDMLRYLTQDEIVAVAAEVATRNGAAIDVEDIAALSLRLGSGGDWLVPRRLHPGVERRRLSQPLGLRYLCWPQRSARPHVLVQCGQGQPPFGRNHPSGLGGCTPARV